MKRATNAGNTGRRDLARGVARTVEADAGQLEYDVFATTPVDVAKIGIAVRTLTFLDGIEQALTLDELASMRVQAVNQRQLATSASTSASSMGHVQYADELDRQILAAELNGEGRPGPHDLVQPVSS